MTKWCLVWFPHTFLVNRRRYDLRILTVVDPQLAAEMLAFTDNHRHSQNRPDGDQSLT